MPSGALTGAMLLAAAVGLPAASGGDGPALHVVGVDRRSFPQVSVLVATGTQPALGVETSATADHRALPVASSAADAGALRVVVVLADERPTGSASTGSASTGSALTQSVAAEFLLGLPRDTAVTVATGVGPPAASPTPISGMQALTVLQTLPPTQVDSVAVPLQRVLADTVTASPTLVVAVIGCADDTGSRADDAVGPELAKSGAVLDVIETAAPCAQPLEAAATMSGGEVIPPAPAQVLLRAAGQLATRLTSMARLTFTLAGTPATANEVTLNAVVDGTAVQRSLVVASPASAPTSATSPRRASSWVLPAVAGGVTAAVGTAFWLWIRLSRRPRAAR